MDTDDPVLTDLRRLREGRGLSAERLSLAGALMSALGTSDPEAGARKLVAHLDKLGDGEHTRALKVDLCLELDELLGRSATPRERDYLVERRTGYSKVAYRGVKTLSRWSDRALTELRSKLIDDRFTGDLTIVGIVEGDRIVGTTTIQSTPGDTTAARTSTDYPNQSTECSMRCLVYGYPRDWQPASLSLMVSFRNSPYPSEIHAVAANNFFELVYATERYRLALQGDMAICKFVGPRTDRIYGIFW